MSDKLIVMMMTLRNQIKLYHWQTMSYPRHKATDDLVDKLDDNIDKFVEVYVGKYGRPRIKKATIALKGFSDKDASSLLHGAIQWLESLKLNKKDTELLNIRDEILADLEQTLYLFTLN